MVKRDAGKLAGDVDVALHVVLLPGATALGSLVASTRGRRLGCDGINNIVPATAPVLHITGLLPYSYTKCSAVVVPSEPSPRLNSLLSSFGIDVGSLVPRRK